MGNHLDEYILDNCCTDASDCQGCAWTRSITRGHLAYQKYVTAYIISLTHEVSQPICRMAREEEP